MSKRFLTYNTEDAEAGKVPVNSQGIIDPEKLPCYDSRDIRTVTYTFDGNLEGKEVVTLSNGDQYVKVSDDYIDVSSFVRCASKTKVIESESEDSYTKTSEFPKDDIYGDEYGVYNVLAGDSLFASRDIEATDENSAISKGVYLYAYAEDGYSSYVVEFTVTYVASGQLKTVDPKYLSSSSMVVSVVSAKGDGSCKLDYTLSEIYKAHRNGVNVFLRTDDGSIFPIESCSSFDVAFATVNIGNDGYVERAYYTLEYDDDGNIVGTHGRHSFVATKVIYIGRRNGAPYIEGKTSYSEIHKYAVARGQVALHCANGKLYNYTHKGDVDLTLNFHWQFGNQYETLTVHPDDTTTVQSGTLGS